MAEPKPLNMVYEKDAPLDALKGKTVAVLGFGSQGHAHSLNLRDSGVKVVVGNRKDSSNGRLAIEHGFEPTSVEDAVQQGDLIILTLPDEAQPDIYNKSIAPHLKAGKALGATHGFNFHFKTVQAPKDVDVLLVAPKGPGHLVRSEFEKGGGVPCLLAVFQNATGKGATWAWLRPEASAALAPASSKPPSRTSAKPTSSASRPFSAAGFPPSSRPASRPSPKPGTRRRWPTLSASTR